MRFSPGIVLGAPGIYHYPEGLRRTLAGTPMDVCAFVGVAPRGPVRIPIPPEHLIDQPTALDPVYPRRRSVAVAVESWDAYTRLYGGFEGPGRLPYAVAAFFEQGGRKAYIVRIVHDYGYPAENMAAVAAVVLPGADASRGTLMLCARSEGRWGNGLQAALGFSIAPLQPLPESSREMLVFPISEALPHGTVLRLHLPKTDTDPPIRQLRFVFDVRRQGSAGSGDERLHIPLVPALAIDPQQIRIERLEADVRVRDGQGQVEHFEHLGLSSRHPRWIAKVLYQESRLVYPHHSWVEADITPQDADALPLLPDLDNETSGVSFQGGEDDYADIDFDDFFDETWTPADPEPGQGVYALTHLPDLASVVVPDLYVPEPLPESTTSVSSRSLASGRFGPCVTTTSPEPDLTTATPRLEKLHLDPGDAADLDEIIRLQGRLAAFARRLQEFVVLLDVPPGLSTPKIQRWRTHFDSTFLAAYYPWLQVSKSDDGRNGLVAINPSAVAAGIIARQELRFGVPHGPANVIAQGVINVDERISTNQHDALHPLGINIFLQQRDGAWLSAARTLSYDLRYRQLSVRRLVTMIKRSLRRQMQWAVFEPNGPALWNEVRLMLHTFLRRLYTQGAFQGSSESEAFFVRCDAQLNPRSVTDAGKMVAEVGLNPAEPLEFIVLHITRGGDGTLIVEG